jgi:hypothetical protein
MTTAVQATTDQDAPKAAPRKPLLNINPLAFIAGGVLLILGGTLVAWLEGGPAAPAAAESSAAQEEHMRRLQDLNLKKARERETRAREEQERQAAEAAADKAKFPATMVDGTAESLARAQREELARKQAAVEAAHRAAAESETAWKRFYQPSAGCREPAAATTIECINEYVKAKREFESRRAPGSS